MSDEEQKLRAIAQKYAIEQFAKELGVDADEAFIIWCRDGKAEEFNKNWNKGK